MTEIEILEEYYELFPIDDTGNTLTQTQYLLNQIYFLEVNYWGRTLRKDWGRKRCKKFGCKCSRRYCDIKEMENKVIEDNDYALERDEYINNLLTPIALKFKRNKIIDKIKYDYYKYSSQINYLDNILSSMEFQYPKDRVL
tara:strand:- start:11116 stop:11538 length:423 start_codon:yes stop_codon:yes gene_type:complete